MREKENAFSFGSQREHACLHANAFCVSTWSLLRLQFSLLRGVLLDIFIKCDTARRCFSSHFRFIYLFIFYWVVYLNFLVVALLLRYLFFPFQAVECLLRQTSSSDVEKEATGVLLVEDFTTDSDPQAHGSKEQLTLHSGINPVNQLSDDTAGVFEDIIKAGIYLDIEWVPRSLNEKADFLSKIVDYDDWELAPGFFWQLDELWGPPYG